MRYEFGRYRVLFSCHFSSGWETQLHVIVSIDHSLCIVCALARSIFLYIFEACFLCCTCACPVTDTVLCITYFIVCFISGLALLMLLCVEVYYSY